MPSYSTPTICVLLFLIEWSEAESLASKNNAVC